MSDYIPPYDGDDMAGFIMQQGFKLPDNERIKSVINIRETAVIVTDYAIWRARPMHHIGFCIELLHKL